MYRLKYVYIVIFALLSACTPFGGFKPPPPDWKRYAKNGASERDIKMAWMECGFPFPGDFFEEGAILEKFGYQDPEKRIHAWILRDKCMKNAGFPVEYDACKGGISAKTGKHIPNTDPACQPNAVIPTRSVERRLNSPYCKAYPKSSYCQP